MGVGYASKKLHGLSLNKACSSLQGDVLQIRKLIFFYLLSFMPLRKTWIVFILTLIAIYGTGFSSSRCDGCSITTIPVEICDLCAVCLTGCVNFVNLEKIIETDKQRLVFQLLFPSKLNLTSIPFYENNM